MPSNEKKCLKELGFVLIVSVSIINTSKKDKILELITYIYYLICFSKNSNIQSYVDIITFIHSLKLSFQVEKTNVKANKIDKSSF